MDEMYQRQQFVDADQLEEDELDYELVIRLESAALRKNIATRRNILRANLRAELADVVLFPWAVNLDLEEELTICMNKLTALAIFCENPINQRSRHFGSRLTCKLNHIEQRLRRVMLKDSSFNQRCNQLIDAVTSIRNAFLSESTANRGNAASSGATIQQQRQSTPVIPTIRVTDSNTGLNLNPSQQQNQELTSQVPWGSIQSMIPAEIALEMDYLRQRVNSLELERSRHTISTNQNAATTVNSVPENFQQQQPQQQLYSQQQQRHLVYDQRQQQEGHRQSQNPFYGRQFYQQSQPILGQYGFPYSSQQAPQNFGHFPNQNENFHTEQQIHQVPMNLNPPRFDADRNSHKTLPVSQWNLTFSGEGKTANLQDFLAKVKVLAKTEKCSNEELRRSAYYLFSGAVREWYLAFGDEYQTWDDIVAELKLNYLAPNNDLRIRRYIDSRRQKLYEPFLSYLADMEQNYQKLSYQVPEVEKVQCIKDNLNSNFAEKLVLLNIRTMDDLKTCCRRIEALSTMQRSEMNQNVRRFEPPRRIAELQYEGEESSTGGYQQFESEEVCAVQGPTLKSSTLKKTMTLGCQTDPITTVPPNFKPNMRCYNCNDYGHHHNSCPQPRTRLFCFRCGEAGVASTNCQRCMSGNGPRGAEGGATSRQ
jgi:hypothetical protein